MASEQQTHITSIFAQHKEVIEKNLIDFNSKLPQFGKNIDKLEYQAKLGSCVE